MLIKNEKMKEILNVEEINFDENSEIESENIVSKTKIIKDCIIYDEDNCLDETKINFERVLHFNKDWTGYEIACNEILLNNQIIKPTNLLKFLESFKKKLTGEYAGRMFCIIVSIDNDCFVLRFHTYRKNEGLWISNDLDIYNVPILYELI